MCNDVAVRNGRKNISRVTVIIVYKMERSLVSFLKGPFSSSFLCLFFFLSFILLFPPCTVGGRFGHEKFVHQCFTPFWIEILVAIQSQPLATYGRWSRGPHHPPPFEVGWWVGWSGFLLLLPLFFLDSPLLLHLFLLLDSFLCSTGA